MLFVIPGSVLGFLFQSYILCQNMFFFIYDFIVYWYYKSFPVTTTSEFHILISIHPITNKLTFSVAIPNNNYVSIHCKHNVSLIKVNGVVTDSKYTQVVRCFLSIILHMNNASYPISIPSSYYYRGNEILSSAFIMYFLNHQYSISVCNFSYTLECMDTNLNIIELSQYNYIELGLDNHYSIITLAS
jgi:hypothetical protein